MPLENVDVVKVLVSKLRTILYKTIYYKNTNRMIEINFYKKIDTSWEELNRMAHNVIDEFEQEDKEILEEGGDLEETVGDLPLSQQYEDYRKALNLGLKSFILQVLVEWDERDILIIDDVFYEKSQRLEIEGILDSARITKLYRNQVDLLKVFSDEKMKIDTDDFDFILDTFEQDVVVTINSYNIKFIDIDDEEDDDDGYF